MSYVKCPHCGSYDTDVDEFKPYFDNSFAIIPFYCHSCGTTWNSVYKFECHEEEDVLKSAGSGSDKPNAVHQDEGKYVVEEGEGSYTEFDTYEGAKAYYDSVDPVGGEEAFVYLFKDIWVNGYLDQEGFAYKDKHGEVRD